MVNVSRVKTKAPLKSNITLKNKSVVNGEKGEMNLHQGLKPKNNSDVTIKTPQSTTSKQTKNKVALETKSNNDVKIKTPKKTNTKVAMRVRRGSKIRVKA